MKSLKITSIIAAVLFVSTTFTAKATSPFVDILLMEIPTKPIIQVAASESVDAYVTISDNYGTLVYGDRINSKTSSAKIFDFSNMKEGTYIIETESDYVDIKKKVVVNNSAIEVISKERSYKPIFIIKDDLLKINYLNKNMKDIELTLENSSKVFFEGKDDAQLSYQKLLDISTLFNGQYYARLEVGDETFYYYFNIN
jgi:hypothetical protein